jgi:hypothetical protein
MLGSLPAARRAALALAAALAIGAAAAKVAADPPGGLAPRRPAAPFALLFDSEHICLSIVGDSLEVRGTYVLLCAGEGPAAMPLFYPFPHDSLLGGFRMVSLALRGGLADPGEGGALASRWEAVPGIWAVRWWLPPCPGDTLVATSVYRQALRSEYARYIVTTTRAWGQPLRHARFEIRLPAGAEPIDFSFPFERSEHEADLYTYAADEFFPDHDIIVRWRR